MEKEKTLFDQWRSKQDRVWSKSQSAAGWNGAIEAILERAVFDCCLNESKPCDICRFNIPILEGMLVEEE